MLFCFSGLVLCGRKGETHYGPHAFKLSWAQRLISVPPPFPPGQGLFGPRWAFYGPSLCLDVQCDEDSLR